MKYLDKDGVSHLWAKIKDKLSYKVDKVDGKGLSTNDYDNTSKNKVDKIVLNGNGNSFLANDGTYKSIDLSEIENRLDGLENLGQYVGTFDKKADVPTNVSSFDKITLNDFVNIRADESKNNVPTRYIAKQINRDTGVITWEYDISFSSDVSGKMDKVTGFTNYIPRFKADGNVESSGRKMDTLVSTDEAQTISGKKTFSTLPQSSVVPTNNNDLANKKYIDDRMKTIQSITTAEIDEICADETV